MIRSVVPADVVWTVDLPEDPEYVYIGEPSVLIRTSDGYRASSGGDGHAAFFVDEPFFGNPTEVRGTLLGFDSSTDRVLVGTESGLRVLPAFAVRLARKEARVPTKVRRPPPHDPSDFFTMLEDGARKADERRLRHWRRTEGGEWRHAPPLKVAVNSVLRFLQPRSRPRRLLVVYTRTVVDESNDGSVPPEVLGYGIGLVLHNE